MENKNSELYEKLSRLQWLLQRHHMQNHYVHGSFADPARGQGRVMAMLKLQPEISTKDLSYLLGIRQQSLNELLNKLEKIGYVVRVPSENDKRVMMVQLTDTGKASKQTDTDFYGFFDCLTPEEQVSFGSYLARIITALESKLGTGTYEEEMENWMRAARARMGSEKFDRMISMCSGFGSYGSGSHGQHFSGGNASNGRRSGGNSRRTGDSQNQPPKRHHRPDEE